MSSDKSNQGGHSDAYEQGRADAKNNDYSPPESPSFLTCALDPHEADRQTQEGTDYRAGYKDGGGK